MWNANPIGRRFVGFAMVMSLPRCVRLPALLAGMLSLLLTFASPAQVTTSVVTDKSAVRPGDTMVIAVVWEFEDGFHIHTNDPKPPKEWDLIAIPTQVSVTSPNGLVVGPPQWPGTKVVEADLGGTGSPLPYEVFGGDRVIVYVPVVVPERATEVVAEVALHYQACNDVTCLRPAKPKFEVRLPVASESRASDDAVLFAGLRPQTLQGDWTKGSGVVSGDANATTTGSDAGGKPPTASGATQSPAGGPAATTSVPNAGSGEPRSFFGIALTQTGATAVVVIFALAVLGGLILNLTPCVLPVIPIKVITLSQHAGTQSRTLYLGLWMAAGVVAFWVGIGVPVIAFSSFGDPSRIFSIWWVTAGLGVLIAVMSLGLMGMFNINLPQGLYMINPKADTAWGSFVFGVMTAVLGLPCFGFVAGALLGAAATLPKVATMAIFLGLGVGMAAPYLVLALFPRLLNSIPRTGPASDLVKQVMGLLMLAAAAYFVGSGLIALVASKPWLGKQLHIWIVAGFGIAASVWLVMRTIKITPSLGRRVAFVLVGLFIAGLGVWYANDATTRARNTYIARQAAMEAAGGGKLLTGTWIEYNAGLFQQARRENKIIVMDFTAEWCINCKVLKASVLEREPVQSAFRRDNVVLFTVDLTADTAPGWATLEALGQTGIPLLAIYTPGSEDPWLSNAYTSAQVLAALEKAGQGVASAR